jgi:hypothetical protein
MNRIIYFTFIVGTLLYGACSGNNGRTKELEAELRLFKAKAIILPDNMPAKHCDEHTPPDTTLLRRPLKMVVYVNQDGYQDCKLRALLPFHLFILENRHLKNFGVIIILNTSQMEAADWTLTDMRFRQTVFYDLDGSFERLNPHLPVNEQFHTFLLDGSLVPASRPYPRTPGTSLYV